MAMQPPIPGGYAAGLAKAAAPPPMQPPGPPPPTGVGAMPTGAADSGSTPRTAASTAIMALRELKNHLPAMAPAIDGFSAQIQSAVATQAGGASGAAAKPPTVPASAASDDGGDDAEMGADA